MRAIDADVLIDEIKKDTQKVIKQDDKVGSFWLGYIAGLVIKQPTIQPVATDTNVGDTISRRAAIDALMNNVTPYGLIDDDGNIESGCKDKDVVEMLYNLPSVQPEPHEGHWIRRDCGFDVECKCSKCGYRDFVKPRDEYWFKRNYCPNCGAKMKGERQK